jgi:hypothetical protein
MTVPGGPWPGHFGLETLAFRATQGVMPPEFGFGNAEFDLDFGSLLEASRGYRHGSGAVLWGLQRRGSSNASAHRPGWTVFFRCRATRASARSRDAL